MIRAFIEAHFDKLLLTLIIFVGIGVGMIAQRPETIAWARDFVSGMGGALISLIVRANPSAEKKEVK